MEFSGRCVTPSKFHNSLQYAWNLCNRDDACEGVIENTCGDKSWALCFKGGYTQESGNKGCFYRKY